jgi:uncharacterized protein YndB with AHSA1/START domain
MTADNHVLEVTRTFDASPARVFNAWIIREEWQSWIGPEGLQCEVPLLEPRVDGRYRIMMKLLDGSVIPVAGSFQVIDPPKRLSFTWGREGDAKRPSVITLTLKDLDEKTELVLWQDAFATVESRDAHVIGWNSALNKLAAHLAEKR